MDVVRWPLLLGLIAGCGFNVAAGGSGPSDDAGDDAPPPDVQVHVVPPRVIPGGGIDDAPIASMVNVYAIDALTGAPILDALVDVGTITGITDATGLFVARDVALAGPQTILVTKVGYRSELWVGVAGANVTAALRPQPVPMMLPSADLSGTITGFNMLPALTGNHSRLGVVAYSQADGVFDALNNQRTAGGTNNCKSATCAYTVTTRTGNVALLAAVFDVDSKGTAPDNDDTRALTTYGYKTGLAVADGVNQANIALALIPAASLVDLSIDFGTPPPGFGGIFGVVGLELAADGTAYLSQFPLPVVMTTIKAPPLSLFPGAAYRFVGFAADQGALSILVKRGLTGGSLVAGTWLVPPTLTAASRMDATWAAPADATVPGALYKQGNLDVLEVLAFDRSSTVTFPTRLVLPTAALAVQATAIRSTFDVTSFSFADDARSVDGTASSAATALP